MTRSSSSAETFTATDRLLASAPFARDEQACRLFVDSFRETARLHYAGNAVFRAFWQAAKIHPDEIQREADLLRAPALMVHLFKERELCSVPRAEVALTLCSSGTGGQKSQQFLSQRALDRAKLLIYRVHEALGLTSKEEVNYLCFTYDPRVASDVGTAFTDELLTSFTGRREVFYAFKWSCAKRDFVFDVDETAAALARFARDGAPVRILGFPAFLHKLIVEKDLRLALGSRAFVQTGGGWKSLANEEIPKGEFRRFVAERLGLPVENVRDLFGMVEHGVPYVDCERGRMHVPNFARVYTRSPDGTRVLPQGDRGLLQLLCTYNDSYPAMNLLTTDWGRVGACDCEIGGPVLELLGRAGVQVARGCAARAADMM